MRTRQSPVSEPVDPDAADSPEIAASDAGRLAALTVVGIGVVYGDIGTSPLYAFRDAVAAASGGVGVVPRPEAVLGILSLILWALIILVSIKYVVILLRADNHGEGGILALMALVQRASSRKALPVLVLGATGAALFYGDALITPAISVMSAVEGVKLAMPVSQGGAIFATIVILIVLFAVQSYGTHRVAGAFGPVMIIWFLVIGGAGLYQIVLNPQVIAAVSPHHAVMFLAGNVGIGLATLGAVFLAVTGAEALYADLGHVGRRPITIAWFFFVLPALVLSYFGQGAVVLSDASAIDNPFYRTVPENYLLPMVALATLATIIASQATITGAFSLTRQAIQLRLLPRLSIQHTSGEHAGQIYLPAVNWLMMAGVLTIVWNFQNSTELAAAYGIAVTGTMIVTAILASLMMAWHWKWSALRIALVMTPFLALELVFLSANLLKVVDGGWVTLLMAACMLTAMLVWWRGSDILLAKTRRSELPLVDLMPSLERSRVAIVPGTGVYLTANADNTPTALLHTIKHFKAMHERIVVLTVITSNWPYLDLAESVSMEPLSERLMRVRVVIGFMQQPNIPAVLDYCRAHGLAGDSASTSFMLSRREFKAERPSAMPLPATALFIVLANNAADATDYFGIPKDRVVEIGTQVGI
ncbi:MAG TPA: potassium transporter Kup [Hyphomicrobiaceae bacterium]|nr:potassium transporter Kup [Hyphomicrobiaceae bacterium]